MPASIVNLGSIKTYSEGLSEAVTALREGGLVIFPTETVYGIGANAAKPQAVARLREAKGRAGAQPFTLHLGEPRDARKYVPEPSPVLKRLVRRGWPGPLTLIVRVGDPSQAEIAADLSPESLADLYQSGGVGMRVPEHEQTRYLLAESGVPVVASSANRAGNPAPTKLEDALSEVGEAVDVAIDGGTTPLLTASTIVEVNGSAWRILRQGTLDERRLKQMVQQNILFVCTGNTCRSPMAEYFFKQQLAEELGVDMSALEDHGFVVHSAGTFAPAGGPISSGSLEQLAKHGINAERHRSTPISTEGLHHANRIYVMTPDHRDAVLDLVPGAAQTIELLDPDRPIGDPVGGGPDEYHAAAEQIRAATQKRVESLLNEDRDW